jgi:hypothetical protein
MKMAENSLTLEQQQELLFKAHELIESAEWFIDQARGSGDIHLMADFLRLLLRAFLGSIEQFDAIVDCGGDGSIFDPPGAHLLRTQLRTFE